MILYKETIQNIYKVKTSYPCSFPPYHRLGEVKIKGLHLLSLLKDALLQNNVRSEETLFEIERPRFLYLEQRFDTMYVILQQTTFIRQRQWNKFPLKKRYIHFFSRMQTIDLKERRNIFILFKMFRCLFYLLNIIWFILIRLSAIGFIAYIINYFNQRNVKAAKW